MPRAPNFSYQDPSGAIASGLVRAIFGDPAKAAEQAKTRAYIDTAAAQAEADRAHAGLYNTQAGGQEQQNRAAASLPELIAAMQPKAAGPATMPVPAWGAEPVVYEGPMQAPEVESPDVAFKRGLPAVIAAIGQMNGDKIDPTKIVGSLASFAAGDELARRGLVAQGHSPDKDFAIDAGRADEIAARDSAAKLLEAMNVAKINHATDIPVANIKAGSDRDVAIINNRDDIPVAQIAAGADRDVAEIKEGGGTPRGIRNNNPGNLEYGSFTKAMGATGSDGRFAIFPTWEAGVRAQEKLIGGPNYWGAGRNTIDAILERYAPASDGNNIENYANYVSRRTGIPRNAVIPADQVPQIAEAMRLFENGGKSGGKPAKAAAPKAVNEKTTEAINMAVDDLVKGTVFENASPIARADIRAAAASFYQATGNIQGAAVQAVREANNQLKQRNAASAKRQKAATTKSAPRPATATSTGPVEPKKGEVRRGYRFKGGDPASPHSWEKV